MDNETFKKAVELTRDIENLTTVIEEADKENHWIKIITPGVAKRDIYYSVRFQDELTEWLKSKKEEYKKEFKELN